MEPNFIRIGPPQVVARTQKLSIQLFFELSAHLQGVARTQYKIMHPTPADGPHFQIVALTQNNRVKFFHRIRATQ
jgi:hypothetical protein